MPNVYQFQAYEPFTPVVTTLGVADTVCLPSIKDGWYYYVDSVIISNLSAATRTFDLHIRPSGTVASSSTQICNDVSVNANSVYQMPIGPLTIPAGWVLSGLASVVASVNVILTGHFRIMPPIDTRI